MKQCKKCEFYKTKDEFAKSLASSDGLQPVCKICHNITMHQYRKNNREKINALSRKRYFNNPVAQREQIKKYESENPSKIRAKSAKRRATKLQRTPKWLTELHYKQIQIFYDSATSLTKEFGVEMEVDHIIPLNGELVSGLHVPWNLQVITQRENLSKGNKAL